MASYLEGGIDLMPRCGSPDDRTGPDVTGRSERIRPTPRAPTPGRGVLDAAMEGVG
jgi:hypothetical protein